MRNYRFLRLVCCCLLSLVVTACEERIPNIPDPITFSREGGSYYQPFSLSIASAHASAIHYTFDGSRPTTDSPVYREPIVINSTTRLSAIALDADGDVIQEDRRDFLLPVNPLSFPYLDARERIIYHVSSLYEYSRDDGATWTACSGPTQTIDDLAEGDKVWVRHRVVAEDTQYLGELAHDSGHDLVAGQAFIATYANSGLNEDDAMVFDPDLSDGTATIGIPTLINRGNEAFDGTVRLEFYASKDHMITEDDIRFLSVSTKDFTLGSGEQLGASEPGSWPTDALWYLALLDMSTLQFDDSVTLVGPYYIGYHITILDSHGNEMVERNNWTLSQHTDQINFLGTSSNPVTGAFKVLNSWGVGGEWEHVHDGAYYIPFEDAVRLELQVIYTLNNFVSRYKPTLLARFEMSHEDRASCVVSVGVGDPANPIMEKRLQSLQAALDGETLIMGVPQAYPSNPMVMDISEFAPYLDTNNLFLRVDNSSDEENQATVSSFLVEFHTNYSGIPSDPISTIIASEEFPKIVFPGDSDAFTLETIGQFDDFQLAVAQPLSRSVTTLAQQVKQRPLSEEEISQILSVQTQKQRSRSISSNSSEYKTGLIPHSESELRDMRTIASLGPFYTRPLPSVVDHSASPYFPPIGNQGPKGSCAAFSNAYYIHTYNEAREHGWDLSGARWIQDANSSGFPSPEYQDRIMSPDFSYHLVSNGPGASILGLTSLLSRIGSATWATMPYDATSDSSSYAYTWPTEEAFREATLYRSREPDASYFQENSSGIILIDSMEKIEIVRQLLAAGYCLSFSVNSESIFLQQSNPHPWLGAQDVVSLSGVSNESIEFFKANLNHAQTIVGYSSGDSWDPENP